MAVVLLDDFNRADAVSLGPRWATLTGMENPSIASNRAVFTSADYARFIVSAYGPDQGATIDVASTTGTPTISLALCSNGDVGTFQPTQGYVVLLALGSANYRLARYTPGFQQLTTLPAPPAAPFSLTVTKHGSTIDIFYDQVQAAAYTSSSVDPALRGYIAITNDGGNNFEVDNFYGGELQNVSSPAQPIVLGGYAGSR